MLEGHAYVMKGLTGSDFKGISHNSGLTPECIVSQDKTNVNIESDERHKH